MTSRTAALGLVVAASVLSACASTTTSSSATTSTTSAPSTVSSTASSSATASGGSGTATGAGPSTTATPTGSTGSAATGTSTTQGIASGEPHPSLSTSTPPTKGEAGISPAATATVGLHEFCGSLAAAHWKPTDLRELRTTTVQATIDEVVARMDRLSSVTPPPELEKDWRASQEAFDGIAAKVTEAGSDTAVPTIIAQQLAASRAAREHVLQVASPCR